MKLFTILFIPVLLAGSVALGQPAVQPDSGQCLFPHPDSCVAMALRNQTAMKNAILNLSVATETRRAAFTKYFPSISALAGYFHAYKPLIDVSASDNSDHITLSATFDGRPISEQQAELQRTLEEIGLGEASRYIENLITLFVDRFAFDARIQLLDRGAFANAVLTQPVFAGGRIINGNKLAQLGVEAAELQLIMTRDEVELNVYQLYCQLLSLQEKESTLHQLQLLVDTLERDVSAGVEAGVVSRNDLLQVQLKRNELTVAKIRLTDGMDLVARALCQYMGLPYDGNRWRVENNQLMYSWLNVQLPNPDFTLTDSPATRLLEIGVEAAALQKRMAVGESLPQMAMGATYGVNNLIGDNLRPNGMLFATINLPVTAWWESAHQIRKQELLRQQAQNTRNDLTEKLLLQKIDAYYQLAAAYRLVGVRQEAIRYAEENLTEVKNYFEAGIYSMKDYLEAQTLLQQARNEAVDQWVDYLLKRLRYRQLARPVSHGADK